MASRDRRKDKVDIESLEKENDRGLDDLGAKVALLRSATAGIKSEVESQHTLLDNMDTGFGSVRGVLSSVTDKFKTVLDDKANRKMIYIIVSLATAALVCWFLFRR